MPGIGRSRTLGDDKESLLILLTIFWRENSSNDTALVLFACIYTYSNYIALLLPNRYHILSLITDNQDYTIS